MTRVLVTGALGPAGRSLVRQLVEAGIPVHGVDMAATDGSVDPTGDLGPGPRATCSVVPAADHPDFLGSLSAIAVAVDATLVIPTVSEELPVLAAASATARGLGAVVDVAIAEPDAVNLAHDKLLTAQSLAAAGVPAPRTLEAAEFTSAAAALAEFGGPIVLKPRVGRGARGVVVLATPSDLTGSWPTGADEVVVQSFAPGPEFCPAVWIPRAGGSREPVQVVLAKTGLTGGRVGNATGVTRLPLGVEADVLEAAVGAVTALGLRGAADVDVRRSASGEPQVLEVNARFGANSAAVPELLASTLAEHEATAGRSARG